MTEPTERDANREAADRLWNGIVRWSGIYEAIATAREEGRREERERCAKIADELAAYAKEGRSVWAAEAIAAHIRSGE